MAKNDNANEQQPIEGEVIPAPPTHRKQIRLSSIKDCRRELAKVYANARCGLIDLYPVSESWTK